MLVPGIPRFPETPPRAPVIHSFISICVSPFYIRQHRTIPALRLKHRSGSCGTASGVAKMLDNVGLRYPHRASGAKAPRTLRPLPLLRFAVSATGGAHLCSIQCYLRFWLGICHTSLAVSALRIMRYCPKFSLFLLFSDMPLSSASFCGIKVRFFVYSAAYPLA